MQNLNVEVARQIPCTEMPGLLMSKAARHVPCRKASLLAEHHSRCRECGCMGGDRPAGPSPFKMQPSCRWRGEEIRSCVHRDGCCTPGRCPPIQPPFGGEGYNALVKRQFSVREISGHEESLAVSASPQTECLSKEIKSLVWL